jgi:hypothetical protein
MMGHESETTLQHARELLNSATGDASSRNGTAASGSSNGVHAKRAASKAEKPRSRRAKS